MANWGGGDGGELIEKYLELLKHSKIKGFLFEQQNYVPNGRGEGS